MATKSAPEAASDEKDQPHVVVRAKKYKLFKRGDDASPWWFRLQHKGERRAESTETADLKLARDRAKGMIIEVLDGKAVVEKKRSMPRIGELIEFASSSHLAVYADTMKDYGQAVYQILKTAYGHTGTQAKKLPLHVLTADLARSYQAKMQGLPRAEVKRLTPGNTTANSQLRSARALFSKNRLFDYKEAGFEMPSSLDGFLSVPFLDEESHRYSDDPIPQKDIQRMDKALPDLKKKDERLWAIHLMVRLMGMRNSEIEKSLDSWLSTTVVKGVERMEMRIIKRTGQRAPKRSEGVVQVPSELVPYFKKQVGHLIPAETKTERSNLIYRAHNEWLRKFIPGRVKGAHELRKHFGAVWATKSGSLYVAAQMLRVTLAVAEYHYSALLNRPEPLSLSDYNLDVPVNKRPQRKRATAHGDNARI